MIVLKYKQIIVHSKTFLKYFYGIDSKKKKLQLRFKIQSTIELVYLIIIT